MKKQTSTHCGKIYVCSIYDRVCACYCESCGEIRDRRIQAGEEHHRTNDDYRRDKKVVS